MTRKGPIRRLIIVLRSYFKPDVRTVRITRVGVRSALAILLGTAYMGLRAAYAARMGETLLFSIWLGTTVGFVTNVIVTWSLLFFFIPRMKPRIARNLITTMKQNMEAGDGAMHKSAGGMGTVAGFLIGLFVPGGLITTLGSGIFGALCGTRLTKKMIERSYAKAEQSILSMNNAQIAATLDKIIGQLLIIMEALGAALGALVGWLFRGISA